MSPSFDDEKIKQCLYSIGDNNAYLAQSRDVISRMITMLSTFFSPDEVEEEFSLDICEGVNNSRLTHTHTRQFHYILQSLTLWRDVSDNMFRLWLLAEEDLLDPKCTYDLQDTGQGYHRVQNAPRTFTAMGEILENIKSQLEEWIGSSVIHLGDRNVPNTLMFIDKYAQVPRILGPIVITVDAIDDMVRNDGIAHYIKGSFGGADRLKKLILIDFFRSAFDGSGADNFFEAGSCIDGRLTSAWNWCSKLETKSYYNIFKLAGFLGFDGADGFNGDVQRK